MAFESPLANPYRRSGYRRGAAFRSRGGRRTEFWSPAQLGLRAWYDAEVGQPRYGGPGAYVQLDGTSGDYIFTPDTATVSFSNDIEVVMRVKVTDWSAAAIQTLVGKYVTTGNQRSWKIASNTSAQIIITVSTDGTTTNTATITPSVALPDNTWIWLRLRMDLTNGSNSVGTVETAADGGTNDEPSSWTANGTATATALAGIFDSTAPLEIGSFNNGSSERFNGQVARCIVRSGFAGATVADFNASDCYGPGYTHSSGYAWTLGLPKIYDRSGNGVAPATFAAGSNQPRWLPWLGVSCVNLESATAGTNSISCTAPSGAASYVARSRDYPNVADATGVASAGAFTFTTAGQWRYISILNGSAVEIARFDASLCSQTGMTDSYSVTWAVNRGTAGRKAVVQSPVAASARSVILHGTDDYFDVPAAAVPTMSTTDNAAVTVAGRVWNTPVNFGRFFSSEPVANTSLSLSVRSTFVTFLGLSDGTNTGHVNTGPTLTSGQRFVLAADVAARSASGSSLALNSDSPSIASNSSVGSIAAPTGGSVGRAFSGGSYQDCEIEAIVFKQAASTATERGLLTAYYRGGL